MSRDVFGDPTRRMAAAAFHLGFVHKKLGVNSPNETPLGTVIAAPPLQARELFCRHGLKWATRIPAGKIRAALREIEKQRKLLRRAAPQSAWARIQALELDLAARMAAQSCRFMLWQQAVSAGRKPEAKRLARAGLRDLQRLRRDLSALWPLRNKATPRACLEFLRWRKEDYRRGFVV